MSHLLQNTYGFDAEVIKEGTPRKKSLELVDNVAQIFCISVESIYERAKGAYGAPLDYFVVRSSYAIHRPLSDVVRDQEKGVGLPDDATLRAMVESEAYTYAASLVLNAWTIPMDGYDDTDYLDFAERVVEQVTALVEDVAQYDVKEHLLTVRKTLEQWFDQPRRFWRYHALSLAEDSHGTGILAPKAANMQFDYGAPAQTVEAFKQRLVETKDVLSMQSMMRDSADTWFNNLYTPSRYSRVVQANERNLSYIRALEVNEFIHNAKDDQTFASYLEQDGVRDDILRMVMVPYSAVTDKIRNTNKNNVPLFLNFEYSAKVGVKTKDLLLQLKRKEMEEMYAHHNKRPELVRTDNRSNTLKYAKGFLEGFFQDESPLDSFESMGRSEANVALFTAIMNSDTERMGKVTYYSSVQQVNTANNIVANPARHLAFFLGENNLDSIMYDVTKRTVFSVFHAYDGFADTDMIDMLLFTKAMQSPKLFSHESGSVENALTVLATAVLEERITAKAAVRMMVLSMQHPDSTPVIKADSSIDLLDMLGETPQEWIMGTFVMKKRQLVMSPEVTPLITTLSKMGQE